MDFWLNSFMVCYVLHEVTWSMPIKSKVDAEHYLKQFHYSRLVGVNNQIGHFIDSNDEVTFRDDIINFQHSWELNETGVLDNETLTLMKFDRCGLPDIDKPGDGFMTRKRRYTLQGSKWHKRAITYKIGSYPKYSALTKGQIDEIIAEAFRIWQDVSTLTFWKSSEEDVDILVLFATFDHGDPFPFDGKGKVLAHAFFPQYGGDAHFDGHEVWTERSSYGTNLFQVVVHELGHSLGLSHSFNRDALMAPFYTGYTPNFRLHPDDIQGIQTVYGAPDDKSKETNKVDKVATIPPSGPNKWDSPDCNNIVIDEITSHMESGKVNTYVFFGSHYARVDSRGMVLGYPRLVATDWSGLQTPIDAALYWPPQYEEKREWDWYKMVYKHVMHEISPARTYFFKDNKYWRYENKQLAPGYPREISPWFRGVPNNLDAAFEWSGNGVTYFVKDDKYYRYKRGSGVDWGYPRHMSTWRGVPRTISTAFTWHDNNKTYFFSGRQYYKFDDKAFKVAPGYPRSVTQWWLKCKSQDIQNNPDNNRTSNTTVQQSITTQSPNSSSVIISSSNLAVVIVMVHLCTLLLLQ